MGVNDLNSLCRRILQTLRGAPVAPLLRLAQHSRRRRSRPIASICIGCCISFIDARSVIKQNAAVLTCGCCGSPFIPLGYHLYRDQKSKATVIETLSKEPPELCRRKR